MQLRSLLLPSRLAALLPVLLVLGSCAAIRRSMPFGPSLKPNVVLAYQDHAAQVVILTKDLDIPVVIHPPDAMPYTDNSHAGIWVGRRFPYNRLAEILEFAPHYYKDLHYVDVSADGNNDLPEEEHYRLFIGGSTADAVHRGLKAWTPADIERLRQVKSQDEMVQFIETFNKKK